MVSCIVPGLRINKAKQTGNKKRIKKSKQTGNKKYKLFFDGIVDEYIYNISDMIPKTVIMSNEIKRRQNEDILRFKHGAKKDKSAVIM